MDEPDEPSMRAADDHQIHKGSEPADRYGLILLLVVVSYLVAVSFPTDRGQSVVLAVQIVTLWLTSYTARAPRWVSIGASVTLIGVAALAVIDLFVVGSTEAIAAGSSITAL